MFSAPGPADLSVALPDALLPLPEVPAETLPRAPPGVYGSSSTARLVTHSVRNTAGPRGRQWLGFHVGNPNAPEGAQVAFSRRRRLDHQPARWPAGSTLPTS